MALPSIIHSESEESWENASNRPNIQVISGGQQIVNDLTARIYSELMERLDQAKSNTYGADGTLNP